MSWRSKNVVPSGSWTFGTAFTYKNTQENDQHSPENPIKTLWFFFDSASKFD